MKILKRIGILALICILIFSAFSVSVCAAETTAESDYGLGAIEGKDMSIAERIEYALQGTVTGLLMIFAVLALLAIVVSLSKVILYDLPRKRHERAKARAEKENVTPTVSDITPEPEPEPTPAAQTDDGELVAVITAAIAAAIESGEYGSEFASGFRVVSFKRVNTNTWNKR